MKANRLGIATAVAIICFANTALAETLLYSYETTPAAGPDGFFGLGATVTQDTIGATDGPHSMKFDILAGQTFVGARTDTVIPAALGNPPGLDHVLFDMTIEQPFGGTFADIGVTLFGHAINHNPPQFGLQAQFADFEPIEGRAAGTYTDLRIDLTSATNPVTSVAGQTFNEIFGPGVDQLTAASAFQFFISKSSDAPLTVYIDNVRVGMVPEPSTFALALTALLATLGVARRRRACEGT